MNIKRNKSNKEIDGKEKRKKIHIILPLLLIIILIGGITFRYISNMISYDFLDNVLERLSTYELVEMSMEVEFIPDELELYYKAEMELVPADNKRPYILFALANGLEFDKVLLEGEEVRVWSLLEGRFIYVPRKYRDENINLTMTYTGYPESYINVMSGYIRDDGVLLSSISSLWSPYFTNENFKIDLKLRAPEPYIGVSGGRKKETLVKDGINITQWLDTGYSSVLFHDYYIYEYSGLKDINIYLPQDRKEHANKIAETADEIKRSYENYMQAVGIDYFNIAFMDRWGGFNFADGLISLGIPYLDYIKTDDINIDVFTLLAHEIAHYYFYSNDMWYGEGFTEFAAITMAADKFGMEFYHFLLNNRIRELSYINSSEGLLTLDKYNYLNYYSMAAYYMGTMMLEGLRNKEGIEMVFEFMNYVRKTDEEEKTLDCLVSSAEKVFGKTYANYFTYWLNEARPAEIDMEIGEVAAGQLELIINSDRKIDLPLEIGIVYPEGDMIIHSLDYSLDNKQYFLDVEEGFVGVALDPDRQLFRLEELDILAQDEIKGRDNILRLVSLLNMREFEEAEDMFHKILATPTWYRNIRRNLDDADNEKIIIKNIYLREIDGRTINYELDVNIGQENFVYTIHVHDDGDGYVIY
ncbi:M1 aminopeptidase family protein [Natronospora cellulosivora (SeqCode)]